MNMKTPGKTRTKLSYRKKVVIEDVTPTTIILAMALVRQGGVGIGDRLVELVLVMAVLFFLFSLVSSFRKSCEPEDEMAKLNQQRADAVAFSLTLAMAAVLMVYSLFAQANVTISLMTTVLLFAGMNITSMLLFLYFDIRGE